MPRKRVDVDVVLCSNGQGETILPIIENIRMLGEKSSVHFWVLESPEKFEPAEKIDIDYANVTRVLIGSPFPKAGILSPNGMYGSVGLALSVQIARKLGQAKYICLSYQHDGMQGKLLIRFRTSKW